MVQYYPGRSNSICKDRVIENVDEPAVLILADSWSGHSKPSQIADLKQMGAKMLRIPPQTTDKLQPLEVNFNRQYKIFYNRLLEESFYQDLLSSVTSREGILNIHSLIHNQFTSPLYNDMILFGWRNTDPNFSTSELSNYPPKMVHKIQFVFNESALCQKEGCNEHAFIKCSHCGRLHCIHHFLNRTCFHNQLQSRSKRETCEQDPIESS